MLDLKAKLNCFVLCCSVLFMSAPAWALSLGFNVSSALVDIGNDVVVEVVAWGEDNDTLSGFDVDIAYNPSDLSLADFTLSNSLGDISMFEALDDSTGANGAGGIDLKVTSLIWPDLFSGGTFFEDQFDGSNSPMTLATLTFSVVSADSTALSFSQVLLADEWATSVSPVSIGTGSINSVPEPATFFLIGMGMVAVAHLSKRKRLRSSSE